MNPGSATEFPQKEERYRLGIVLTHATQFDGPLFRFLAARGSFDLTIYYTRGEGQAFVSEDAELGTKSSWDIDVISGYQHVVCGEGWGGRLRFLRRIIADRPDLVIVCGYQPAFHLAVAFWVKLHGQAVGLRSDSILSYGQPGGAKGALKRWLLPKVMALYTTGHPTGSLAREYLIHFGFDEQSLFLFPYNVDNDWLGARALAATGSGEALRRSYGIPQDAFVVLGILKFVPREDPMTLLRGFVKLHEGFPRAHLVMVGDGSLRGEIEAAIRAAGLQANVHLPGLLPYSQLPSHFVLADAFVHPARREQWGVSVNEAMACGAPVVAASTVGAGRDLIEEGVTGFIFEAGHPEALAGILAKLAESEALRKMVAANAVGKIRAWSYAQTAREMEKALAYVLGGRSPN